MPTEKQIEANRENAKKSTGPTTPEGRMASSQNARRHGLCANHPFLLPGEDPREFDRCRRDLHNAYDVTTNLEGRYVEKMASLHWSIMRARRMESALIREGMHRTMSEEESIRTDGALAFEQMRKMARQEVAEQSGQPEQAVEPERAEEPQPDDDGQPDKLESITMPVRDDGWQSDPWMGSYEGGGRFPQAFELRFEETEPVTIREMVAGPLWLAARGFMDEKVEHGLKLLQRYEDGLHKRLGRTRERLLEYKRYLDKREIEREEPRWYYEQERRKRWTAELREMQGEIRKEFDEAQEYREALRAAKESGELDENLEEDDRAHIDQVVERHATRIRAEKAKQQEPDPHRPVSLIAKMAAHKEIFDAEE